MKHLRKKLKIQLAEGNKLGQISLETAAAAAAVDSTSVQVLVDVEH